MRQKAIGDPPVAFCFLFIRDSVTMLRAIIFDCDGVIADTEPMHLAAFQRVLEEEGILLTSEQYYRDDPNTSIKSGLTAEEVFVFETASDATNYKLVPAQH